VYAELGSTWRFLMPIPGRPRMPWESFFCIAARARPVGHDSIWYGSPQDQIQAFRAFQIAPALREKHGYPEITPQLRAKVFGLNAAKIYG